MFSSINPINPSFSSIISACAYSIESFTSFKSSSTTFNWYGFQSHLACLISSSLFSASRGFRSSLSFFSHLFQCAVRFSYIFVLTAFMGVLLLHKFKVCALRLVACLLDAILDLNRTSVCFPDRDDHTQGRRNWRGRRGGRPPPLPFARRGKGGRSALCGFKIYLANTTQTVSYGLTSAFELRHTAKKHSKL